MLVGIFQWRQNLRQFKLGSFGSAILKLAAISVAPSAVISLFAPILMFIPFGGLAGLAAEFILYFALLGMFFDLDESDTWFCVWTIFRDPFIAVYLSLWEPDEIIRDSLPGFAFLPIAQALLQPAEFQPRFSGIGGVHPVLQNHSCFAIAISRSRSSDPCSFSRVWFWPRFGVGPAIPFWIICIAVCAWPESSPLTADWQPSPSNTSLLQQI